MLCGREMLKIDVFFFFFLQAAWVLRKKYPLMQNSSIDLLFHLIAIYCLLRSPEIDVNWKTTDKWSPQSSHDCFPV